MNAHTPTEAAPITTAAELEAALREAGFEADRAAALARLAEPSIRLFAEPIDDDDDALGSVLSGIGGLPYLPSPEHWPRNRGVPLTFVAQLYLPELAPFDVAGRLPSRGMLSFFYDVANMPWNARGLDARDAADDDVDPSGRGAVAVLYTPAGTLARRYDAPDDLPTEGDHVPPEGIFRPCRLKFARALTLPTTWLVELAGLKLTSEELDVWLDLRDRTDLSRQGHWTSPNDLHRVLGTPDCVQQDWYVTAPDILLLQLDSEEVTEMQWEDLGRIYFVVDGDALKQGRVEGLRLTLETT